MKTVHLVSNLTKSQVWYVCGISRDWDGDAPSPPVLYYPETELNDDKKGERFSVFSRHVNCPKCLAIMAR